MVNGAIVLHANVGNIDTVIVDGKILKENGKLVGIDWLDLSDKMNQSRDRIIEGFNRVDKQRNIEIWQNIFGNNVKLD